MTQEEFKKLIEESPFLGEERQKLMLENAAWMTPDERAALAKNILSSGESIEKTSSEALENLETFEEAIKDFTHEELPKLLKEQEGEEHSSEEKEAEHLLDEF